MWRQKHKEKYLSNTGSYVAMRWGVFFLLLWQFKGTNKKQMPNPRVVLEANDQLNAP